MHRMGNAQRVNDKPYGREVTREEMKMDTDDGLADRSKEIDTFANRTQNMQAKIGEDKKIHKLKSKRINEKRKRKQLKRAMKIYTART